MLKKREGYKHVISPEADERIKNNQCPVCGKPKDEWTRRKDWRCCSAECSSKFYKDLITYTWDALRRKAFKRDFYRCRICGMIPTTIMEQSDNKSIDDDFENYINTYCGNPILLIEERKGRKMALVVDETKLVGDHITPIALGGDEWDLNNIQTLCISCNKVKTRYDAGKIAMTRNNLKKLVHGQKTLKGE